MKICNFRLFKTAWGGGTHRWVWMALGAPEGPVAAEARGEARETADTSRADTDPDGNDAAQKAQEAARELIARVQDTNDPTYGPLSDFYRSQLSALLETMFNKETDQYGARVEQFQRDHADSLQGAGVALADDLNAIVALAEGTTSPPPISAPAAPAAEESHEDNLAALYTVRPGDTMSAIIRDTLANSNSDGFRLNAAVKYGELGDDFPSYDQDPSGTQFMRLLIAKRNPDYYQNLIHPGNKVRFGKDGSITISKGDAKYAPGEKEKAAAEPASPAPAEVAPGEPATAPAAEAESALAERTATEAPVDELPASDAVATAAPSEAAPAAPERSQEQIAALNQDWTNNIEPEIRRVAGTASVTIHGIQSSGPDNLEKTVVLINPSGDRVALIVKPPLKGEIYGKDSSKKGFLVVDVDNNKITGYTQVFGEGNQLESALAMLNTANSASAAEAAPAPAAPATESHEATSEQDKQAAINTIKEYLQQTAPSQKPARKFREAMEEYSQHTLPNLLHPMSVNLRKEIVAAVGMQSLDADATGVEGLFMMRVDNENPALGSFDLYYNASKNQFNTRKVPLAEARRAERTAKRRT